MNKRWIVAGCVLSLAAVGSSGAFGPSGAAGKSKDGEEASDPLPKVARETTKSALPTAELRPETQRAVQPSLAKEHGEAPQALAVEAPSADSAEGPTPSAESPPISDDQVILDDAFRKQALDAGWEREARTQVDQALAMLVPESSRVADRQCKSTLCRVEIDHDASESHLALVSNARKGVAWPGEVVIVSELKANGMLMTVAYFARVGHPMPELP